MKNPIEITDMEGVDLCRCLADIKGLKALPESVLEVYHPLVEGEIKGEIPARTCIAFYGDDDVIYTLESVLSLTQRFKEALL